MLLFALLVAVPIIEIALFIQVGGAIGLFPTLAIVIATAIAGTIMLRTQGLATLQKLQSSVQDGQNPMNPIAHGALILVSGVLLLTPGFFTDALGLALLLPPVRDGLIRAGAARMAAGTFHVKMETNMGGGRPQPQSDDQPIEGDYTVLDDGPPGNSGWTKRD